MKIEQIRNLCNLAGGPGETWDELGRPGTTWDELGDNFARPSMTLDELDKSISTPTRRQKLSIAEASIPSPPFMLTDRGSSCNWPGQSQIQLR